MWPIPVKDMFEFLVNSEHTINTMGHCLPGARLTAAVTDSRLTDHSTLFVPIVGERFDGHDFIMDVKRNGCPLSLCDQDRLQQLDIDSIIANDDFCLVVVTSVLDTYRALADWFRQRLASQGIPILAIGGSNGKTTTKELIRYLLGGEGGGIQATEYSENGYLGIAKTLTQRKLTTEPPENTSPTKVLLTEIGIDTVGAMAAHHALVRPDIALITNLAEEHLAGLINLQTVIQEELTLLQPGSVRVWQWDDPEIRAAAINQCTPSDWVAASVPWPATAATVGSEGGEAPTEGDIPPRVQSHSIIQAFLAQHPTLTGETSPHVVLLTQSQTSDQKPDDSETGGSKTGNQGKGMTAELATFQVWLSTPGAGALSTNTCLNPHFTFSLPGKHNASNLCLATAAALAVGALKETVVDGHSISAQLDQLMDFNNAEYRSDLRRFPGGDALYVDCYNANPASVAASLSVLNQTPYEAYNKLVFLGDMLDLGPGWARQHEQLLEHLRMLKHCAVFLYGPQMKVLADKIKMTSLQPPVLIEYSENDYKRLLSAAQRTLDTLASDKRPVVGLLKASRGMKMEVLIEPLSQAISGRSAPGLE